MSVQCPACHAKLDLVVVGPPAPAPVETTPDAGARRWVLEVEDTTLRELLDEERRAAGMHEEPGPP